MKRGDVWFNPIEPPELQKDPVDQKEQPEPTPLKSPPPELAKPEGEEGDKDDEEEGEDEQ